jgi:hypothetical protein
MGETTIAGSAETAATNPAKAGESVLSRINQGIVIITIELPSPDAKFEIWRRMTGDFFFISLSIISIQIVAELC